MKKHILLLSDRPLVQWQMRQSVNPRQYTLTILPVSYVLTGTNNADVVVLGLANRDSLINLSKSPATKDWQTQVILLLSDLHLEDVPLVLDIPFSGLVSQKKIGSDIQPAVEATSNEGIFISPLLTTIILTHLKKSNQIPQKTDVLTKTEFKVLRAARHGLTNKQLASQLYVSPSTIHSHCKSIYRKLGVRGRVEAINVVFGGK